VARPNYGPQAHQRTRALLAAILSYANNEIEGCDRLEAHIESHWQTEKRLIVRTKVRYLEALCRLVPSLPHLRSSHIKEGLKRLADHVEILDDLRTATQGSEVWHFALNLWSPRFDTDSNLRRFDSAWEVNRPSKSKQVAGSVASLTPKPELPPIIHKQPPNSANASLSSWGEAPDVSAFHGRQEELAMLQAWVIADQCRLITLLGMGGIGKTALSVKLAQQLVPQFEGVIWRSLRNAPPIQHLLEDLLLTLSQQQRSEVPLTTDGSIIALLQDLQTRRVLLVLDNVESILEAGQAQGAYRLGYEEYGHLIRSLSDSPHQSCVILTSREKPIGLSAKEGPALPIRSYQLKGVEPPTARQILQDQGIAIEAGETLIDRYNGNPLALKIAIATIRDLFGGDIAAFLAEDTVVFGDIADLLSQQINRLSSLEWQLMQWLAICREPASLADLQKKLVPPILTRELITALTALQRRSLIDQASSTHFTQQPVVMEYVTEQIIAQCVEAFDIDTPALADLLNTLALMEADATDYIRQTQRRVIINPIAQRINARLGTTAAIREQCDRLLAHLHANPQPGYAAGNLINLMHTWQLDLTGYDFSHLSIWQVYLQDLALPATNFTGADLSRSVFTQTLGGFLAAAFSPDGQELATAISNEVVVWDIGQGKQLFAGQGHTAWIVCLAYSPDQTIMASGSRDETIRLWDAETGQCLKTLACPGSWIQTLAFSPDGETLVSGGSDGEIRLWQVETAHCQQVLSGHCDRILSLKFTADGHTLVSGSQDETVAVWDFDSGDRRHTWNIPLNWTLAMDLSPDGQTLVTGSDGKAVKFWDLATGECLKSLPDYSSRVWSVALSPNGQYLLTASEDKSIKLWDVYTGDCLRTLLGHTHSVWLAAFSEDGRSLVSASNDQTVKVWEAKTGRCCQTFTAYSNWIQSIAFSPVREASPEGNGKTLASSGEEHHIRLWQTSSGTCQRCLTGHTNQVSCVAFSPAGDQLASGSDDATIRLWNPATGDCLRVLRGHTGWVQSVAFSPHTPILASGSHDHTVRLWDVISGECLQVLEGHLYRVKAVAFSPDGRLVASGSDDHSIKLWEIESGVCVQTLDGHRDWVLSVAFHPEQPLLASGSGDRTLKLWDLNTGDCICTLTQHTQRVRSVTFSPNGQLLASGGDDGTVRLWNPTSGECLQVMAEHTRAVWTVAFSTNGETLASCSEDETIRFWNVATGECLNILRPQRPYEGMNITNVTGLTLAQRNTLIALGALDANLV